MPLCWVFERKKGTVCRAGLDRRVQSKCLVAELLSREQKVAHNVVVSFLLHQIKPFFFFFSGRPAAPEPMQAGEMRRLQREVKKKKETKITKTKKKIQYISTRHFNTPGATERMKSGAFWSVTNNAKRVNCWASSTPNLSQNCLQQSQRLMVSSDRLRERLRQVYCPRSSSRVNTCTHSLVFVRFNYKSEKIQAACEWFVEEQNWRLQRQKSQTSARTESHLNTREERRYCIWLPTCFSAFGNPALINRLHCGMKLLFQAIMVHTVHRGVEVRGCSGGVFSLHRNEAVVCCSSWPLILKQVHTAWESSTFRAI